MSRALQPHRFDIVERRGRTDLESSVVCEELELEENAGLATTSQMTRPRLEFAPRCRFYAPCLEAAVLYDA